MISLKNKFIFAPVKIGYTNGNGIVNDKHINFYTKRCKWVGAVDLEPLYMDKGLREVPTQLGVDSDDKIEGLGRLTDEIHKTDTKVIANLNHPGRMANPKIPGNYFVSSSDKACAAGGPEPEKLGLEDIKKIVKLFTVSAVRAEKAGVDIIELQFGHGYLVSQFLSPVVNDRTDKYGGSFENRIRFSLEVLASVKDAVSIPVIVRISADEMTPEGVKLPEMIKFAGELENHGVEALHISAGSLCTTPPWFFHHMFVPKGKTWELAAKIKESIKIPVIFVGKVNTLKDIRFLESEYSAEYIAAGRALVADSDFFGKIQGKVNAAIRPCLECSQGCLGGVKSGKGLQCLVDPKVGKEVPESIPMDGRKYYAVVGGGLAGMEAALSLVKNGNKVDLFEKDSLGGQFNLAPLTPNKSAMNKLVPFYKEELKLSGVNILIKEVSADELLTTYDSVILATGAVSSVPPIPGLENFRQVDILFDEKLPVGKKILIIGGGLTGVDIATALIPLNNQIIIVKRSTDFGQDMEMISKKLSLKMMKENGVIFSDYTHIKKVEGSKVTAERNGDNLVFEDIDLIIVSSGVKSYNPLEAELKGKIPVSVIGDAKVVGDAQDAIADAYYTTVGL
ncbi:MAG: NAD(P)/FAD-dependent oxidoreductase [Spirochaetota bacterium]|nr:NAD(P)/FAD-dependent oxidoreductase [Spirochaetota bacterium]